MIAGRLNHQRVPHVRRHLHALVLERLTTPLDDVVDRAVVFERIASGQVVVVLVTKAPDDACALITLPGQRLEFHGYGDIRSREVVIERNRKSIVRRIRICLDEHLAVHRIVSSDDPDAWPAIPGQHE